MAGTTVAFGGNSLQTGAIVTSDIGHHGGPDINAPVYPMSHANANAMPYMDWPQKVIPIKGELIASSLAGIDALEDTFKSYLTARNAFLDIGYNGGTRRYIANVTKWAIDRPQDLFKSSFELEFTCQPFGMDTGSNLLSPNNLITNPNFTTNTSGWSGENANETLAVDLTNFYFGSSAMSVQTISSGPNQGALQSVTSLTGGATYTLSAWVLVPLGVAFSINMNAYATSTFIANYFQSYTGNGTWQYVSLTATIPSSANRIDVIPVNVTTAQTFDIDGVVLQVASSTNATTLTPSIGGTAPYQYPIISLAYGSANLSTTNLITNPGFETDLSGWSTGGVGTATRVTTQHNTGVAALQEVNAGTAVGGNFGWEYYLASGLTIGQAYQLTAYMKGNAGGEVVKMNVAGANPLSATLSTSWVQFTMNFVATATTMELDFISTSPASGTWFLDDVSLVTVGGTGTVNVGNNATGQAISVTRSWSPGDVLTIDATQLLNTTPNASYPVTVNGAAIAFSGALAELAPGTASLFITDNLTNRLFTIYYANQNRYL